MYADSKNSGLKNHITRQDRRNLEIYNPEQAKLLLKGTEVKITQFSSLRTSGVKKCNIGRVWHLYI